MKIALIVAAISAVQLSSATQAAAPQRVTAANQQPATARLQQALQLAKAMEPEDNAIAVQLANYKAGLLHGLERGGGAAKFEAKHPGRIARTFERGRTMVAANVHRRLPQLWNRMAEIFVRELSSEQISQLTTFFQSSVGRKLVHNSVPNIEVPAQIKDPTAHTDTPMTAQDTAELKRFASTDVGKMMGRVGPLVDKARDAWSEEPDPEFEKAILQTATTLLSDVSSETSPGTKRRN